MTPLKQDLKNIKIVKFERTSEDWYGSIHEVAKIYRRLYSGGQVCVPHMIQSNKRQSRISPGGGGTAI